MIGRNNQLRPLNAQRAGFKLKLIVPLCLLSVRRDGITADAFPCLTGNRKGEQLDSFVPLAKGIGIGSYAGLFIQHRRKRPAFFVSVQAVDFHFPFGILIAIALLRIYNLNGQVCSADAKDGGYISHRVIALLRIARGRNGILADNLALGPGQIIVQNGCFVAALESDNRCRKLRIVLAVLL